MMNINQIRSGIRAKHFLPNATIREQGRFAGASHQSMLRLNKRCSALSLDYTTVESLSDSELIEKLYPATSQPTKSKRQPVLNEILKELTKARGKRKSRTVLYLEYVSKDPETALSRTHFFRITRKALKRCKLSMRQFHAAGEVLYIDYAGTKVFYLSAGIKVWVKIFVAVLGASKKIFAWATYGEKTQHWIDGMTRTCTYLGGITEVISMDNAKALVTTPGLIANLNQNIVAFGEHFNVIMDTCRVSHPQDKSDAELGVKFVTQRVLIPMLQNHQFFSLDEINQHLTQEVEKLNNYPFQGSNISRNDLFEKNEKEALKPLPKKTFTMIVDTLKQKVPPSYHIKYLHCEYSVPYTLRGNIVEVIVDQTSLRVVFDNEEVAKHQLLGHPSEAVTLEDHMPVEHLADMRSTNKTVNLAWANDMGGAIEALVVKWYNLSASPSPRAIGKRCQALKTLIDKHGTDTVKQACEYALMHGMSTPDDIRLVISAKEDESGFENLPVFNGTHQNIRGKSYYGGCHEA